MQLGSVASSQKMLKECYDFEGFRGTKCLRIELSIGFSRRKKKESRKKISEILEKKSRKWEILATFCVMMQQTFAVFACKMAVSN